MAAQDPVEALRARTGLSEAEARALLDQAGGDLLEALILLDRQGRAGGAGGFYSTRPGGTEPPPLPLPTASEKKRRKQAADAERPGFGDQLEGVLEVGWDILRHSVFNRFEVWRGGTQMTSMPVLILILLIIVAFWLSAALLGIGLLFGCTYRFSGPDLNWEKVNQVTARVSAAVSGAVDRIKDEFRQSAGQNKKKK